mmetsp:Transcript_38799/g.91880  ORF Transcript_38799/g.91880 Transcript_38799/m.91880 type:complete len:230 (+) Transcript_38799:700-1389(+)
MHTQSSPMWYPLLPTLTAPASSRGTSTARCTASPLTREGAAGHTAALRSTPASPTPSRGARASALQAVTPRLFSTRTTAVSCKLLTTPTTRTSESSPPRSSIRAARPLSSALSTDSTYTASIPGAASGRKSAPRRSRTSTRSPRSPGGRTARGSPSAASVEASTSTTPASASSGTRGSLSSPTCPRARSSSSALQPIPGSCSSPRSATRSSESTSSRTASSSPTRPTPS